MKIREKTYTERIVTLLKSYFFDDDIDLTYSKIQDSNNEIEIVENVNRSDKNLFSKPLNKKQKKWYSLRLLSDDYHDGSNNWYDCKGFENISLDPILLLKQYISSEIFYFFNFPSCKMNKKGEKWYNINFLEC